MPNPTINRRLPKPASGPTMNPVVSSWATRVVANGGAAPTAATKTALNTFYNGLVTDGLDTLMIALNVVAPDSLIAAMTPLIKVAGNDPWTNGGFVSGDLSVNGLHAAGNSLKHMESGVNPTTAYASNNDAGITFYSGGGTNTNQGVAWAYNGGSSFALYENGTNYNIGCYNTWDITPAEVSAPGVFQFASTSRTASNAANFYLANSALGFTHPGTTAGASAVRPNLTLPFGVRNFNGAYNLGPSVDVFYSFCCVHNGLTSAQTQKLFNRVQTLRTTFGGGFS